MSTDAYENRCRMVTQLIGNKNIDSMTMEDVRKIDGIVVALDRVVSGRPYETPSWISFQEYFRSTVSGHETHTRTSYLIRDWYKHEIDRLTRNPASDGGTVYEEVFFPRQSGVSTFLLFYAGWRASNGDATTLVYHTNSNANEVLKKFNIDTDLMKLTTKNRVVTDALPNSQVIFDTVLNSVVDGHSHNQIGGALLNTETHDHGEMVSGCQDSRVFSYRTIQ